MLEGKGGKDDEQYHVEVALAKIWSRSVHKERRLAGDQEAQRQQLHELLLCAM